MPSSRTKILLTGFEPYGGSSTNISQQILDAVEIEGVAKLCLPVSFKRAPEVLREAVERYQPEFILSMGQCVAGEKIRLERFAMNLMDCEKGDNDGYQPNEETIDANAPMALRTGLNIKQIQIECVNAELPTIISNSAGLYVCNRIYFEALRFTGKALFVHIPKNMNNSIVLQTIRKIMSCIEFYLS